MALIEINGLTKTYNPDTDIALTVLHGIDLKIERGEFVAIMGPSGSGKSTLMHLLGFLDTPSSGEYIFDGTQTESFDEDQLADIRNREVGFVFQAFHLLGRTTARDNVRLPLLYAGIADREQVKRADDILTKVGLGDRLDHEPNELSGGQQQRVSIARALVNEPKVLFADEPTGNLDTQSSNEIMKLFCDIHADGGTIVMVTHEEDIAAFATRVLRVRDGYLESDTKNPNPTRL